MKCAFRCWKNQLSKSSVAREHATSIDHCTSMTGKQQILTLCSCIFLGVLAPVVSVLWNDRNWAPQSVYPHRPRPRTCLGSFHRQTQNQRKEECLLKARTRPANTWQTTWLSTIYSWDLFSLATRVKCKSNLTVFLFK